MINPILIVDTWQYGGEIDEGVLLVNDVKVIFIRINLSDGSLVLDPNFSNQWNQARNMVRVPYFVYSPLYLPSAQLAWLKTYMPVTAKAIIMDVEVRRTISPEQYAARYRELYDSLIWNKMTYTGGGSLDLLASWPEGDYWWAQYPFVFYPDSEQARSWEWVRAALVGFSGPLNSSTIPGRCRAWQFSGDKLILPGCDKAMDVSVWMGTEQELLDFAGAPTPPEPSPLHWEVTGNGIEFLHTTRFGAPVFVHRIDPKVAKVWVSGREDDFQTVAQTVSKNQASGGTNGGGWPYGQTYANEIWKSRGKLLQAVAKDGRPWVGFTTNGSIVFGKQVPALDIITDVVGYDRFLLENGVKNERYRTNTVKDARTFSGLTRDGKFLLVVCEGDDRKNYGLTFWEEALVLEEFDCHTGGNHDGGSSSTCVNLKKSSGSLNVPSDGTPAYVINAILFKGGETPVPPPSQGGSMQYKVINPVRPRLTPSMYQAVTLDNLVVGTFIDVVEIRTVSEIIDGSSYNITFVKMSNGYWVPVYLAYKNTTYLQEVTTTPPAGRKIVRAIVEFDDGSSEELFP